MTRDDIIRMACESGVLIPSFRIGGGLALGTCTVPDFERFAALVAAVEREACAAICDAEGREWDSDDVVTEKNYAAHCAHRIRARGDA